MKSFSSLLTGTANHLPKWNGMVVFQDLLLTYVFNTYIDGLLFSLQSSDLGCHIGSEYIGCMAYADDVIIISASIIHL